MEGRDCSGWSVWNVLLHPRRALCHIDDADIKKADIESRLKDALGLLEEREKECANLAADNAEIHRRCSDNEKELAEMRRSLEETRRELAEQDSVDEKLMEMDRKLAGFEKIKRDYEKRISILEARLRDAKIKYLRAEDDELIDRIDMRPPDTVCPTVANYTTASRTPAIEATCSRDRHSHSWELGPEKQDNADDWLLTLPPDF